jgi:hypothetical protein
MDENVDTMDQQDVQWPGEWQAPRQRPAPGRRWAGILCAVAGIALLGYFANDARYPLRERREAEERLHKLHQTGYAGAAEKVKDAEAAARDATYRLRVDGLLALLGGVALTAGWSMSRAARGTTAEETHAD